VASVNPSLTRKWGRDRLTTSTSRFEDKQLKTELRSGCSQNFYSHLEQTMIGLSTEVFFSNDREKQKSSAELEKPAKL
jgi:hypothetical protein